jgi:hypothetical protein
MIMKRHDCNIPKPGEPIPAWYIPDEDPRDEPSEENGACPQCGNTHLGLLHPDQMKVCMDCDPHFYFPWDADDGRAQVFPVHQR